MGAFIDLTGQRFGMLLAESCQRGAGRIRWLCHCDCGSSVTVASNQLRSGMTKSCGCSRRSVDLSGQRFGRWVVVRRAENGKHGDPRWTCRCDCGEESDVLAPTLRNGDSQSCGCLNRELRSARATTHGMSKHPLYSAWNSMRQRCNNPNHPNYHHYGGRGIAVDPRWDDFAVFLADMGERPDGATLDRVDVNAGYSPENCRWASWEEQHANTRRMIALAERPQLIARVGELESQVAELEARLARYEAPCRYPVTRAA